MGQGKYQSADVTGTIASKSRQTGGNVGSVAAKSYIQERWVTVPYSAEIADRVRSVLSDRDNVREVKMFGGLAFMVDERMVVCVSSGGGALLVRVAPEQDAEYLKKAGAQRAEMGKGRSMGEGWITIDEEALEKDEDLQYWMDASLAFHAQGSGKKRNS